MNDTKIPHVSKIHPKNDFKHTLLCFWSLNFFVFCFTFSVIIFCRGLGTTEYICATYTTVLFASAFILFRCGETPFMFALVNHRVLLKFQKQTNIVILNPWMSLLNLTFNLKIFFFREEVENTIINTTYYYSRSFSILSMHFISMSWIG